MCDVFERHAALVDPAARRLAADTRAYRTATGAQMSRQFTPSSSFRGLGIDQLKDLLIEPAFITALHHTFNARSGHANVAATSVALQLVTTQRLSFAEVYDARLAHAAMDEPDCDGIVIHDDSLARVSHALSLCGRLAPADVLVKEIKTLNRTHVLPSRLPLDKFLLLCLVCTNRLRVTASVALASGTQQDERGLYTLDDSETIGMTPDQRRVRKLELQLAEQQPVPPEPTKSFSAQAKQLLAANTRRVPAVRVENTALKEQIEVSSVQLRHARVGSARSRRHADAVAAAHPPFQYDDDTIIDDDTTARSPSPSEPAPRLSRPLLHHSVRPTSASSSKWSNVASSRPTSAASGTTSANIRAQSAGSSRVASAGTDRRQSKVGSAKHDACSTSSGSAHRSIRREDATHALRPHAPERASQAELEEYLTNEQAAPRSTSQQTHKGLGLSAATLALLSKHRNSTDYDQATSRKDEIRAVIERKLDGTLLCYQPFQLLLTYLTAEFRATPTSFVPPQPVVTHEDMLGQQYAIDSLYYETAIKARAAWS
jgi:hypothetical protein